jgi:hypothetical protein
MPYKIIFLLAFSIFCVNAYADCSPEDISKIKKNSVLSNHPNSKITYISKDNKCRFSLNHYGRFQDSYVFVNFQGYDTAITDGPRITWYDNGQKKSEFNVVMDKIHGLGTSWYKNGVKQSEANYKENVIDGVEITWNDKGEKISEVIYVNGLRKTDQTVSENGPNDTSNQDPIEIAKNTCKKLGLKEKTEKFGICVLKNIN